MKDIVVYTVIFRGYDELRPPLVINKDVDYICFTDVPLPNIHPWQQCLVTPKRDAPRRYAKMYKILSHQLFPQKQYTLYHDGNIRLKTDPVEALDRWLTSYDMAVCQHQHRNCIYDEAECCLEGGPSYEPERIKAQMRKYRAEGYPEHNGLGTTTVILRRHTDEIREFNEAWWDEMVNHSVRGQLSFNYVCWKLGVEYDVIPGNVFRHIDFDYLDHVRGREGYKCDKDHIGHAEMPSGK